VAKNGNAHGLLSSLAGMPGARTKTHERVEFDVTRIDKAMEDIRQLQGTGALTIHFVGGRPSGTAKWETSLLPGKD
jgi:hypothetical protein